MNVYGPPGWVESVCTSLAESGVMCAPVVVETTAAKNDSNLGFEVVQDSVGVQNRNVVLATMRLADILIFEKFVKALHLR